MDVVVDVELDAELDVEERGETKASEGLITLLKPRGLNNITGRNFTIAFERVCGDLKRVGG